MRLSAFIKVTIMVKILEKILLYLDKYQKVIIYLALTFTILFEILYVFFHTREYGYDAEISDNISSAIFTIVMVLLAARLHNIPSEKLDKRVVTLFYVLVFLSSVIQLCGGLYCILVEDISIIAVVILYIPLFILLSVLLYKTRCFYIKFAEKISAKLKNNFDMLMYFFNNR